MSAISRQKLDQAAQWLSTGPYDAWITFVRETSGGSDPVLPLVLDGGLTWQSALIVFKNGRKVAVVGNYDADPLVASGDWDEVVPYVQSIRPALREVLCREMPGGGAVAVNWSESDDKADGLTLGMYRVLQRHLEGLPIELVSAEPLLLHLRGVKSGEELRRMRGAIAATEEAFRFIEGFARIGRTEREVYDAVQEWAEARGYGFSWDPVGDPIVNSGPDSMVGHGIPSSTIQIAEGHVFHIDLGLLVEGYASDLQRCWYVGDAVPEDVSRALDAVNGAISAAAEALRPGVQGWTVDAAARAAITGAGYPEYMHAVGHQVGRMAHDGGGILGPQWERYGETPRHPVEAGQVYTLELGVEPPGRGYLGIEEMVLVTDSGCEFLSRRQTSMPLLPR